MLDDVVDGCVVSPGNVYVGCEMSSATEYSLSGVSVDDVVVWERYLYDWETYRFKGLTGTQHMLKLTSQSSNGVTRSYI